MPWVIRESNQCPSAKRWGVFVQTSGELVGCHNTIASAKKQQAALYANEPSARSKPTAAPSRQTGPRETAWLD